MRRVVILVVIVVGIAAVWQSRRNKVQTPAATGSATTDSSARQLGPFVIGRNEYRVVLHEKPRLPGSTQETGNTVVKMDLQDSVGTVVYERTFPVQTELEGFSDAWFVTA